MHVLCTADTKSEIESFWLDSHVHDMRIGNTLFPWRLLTTTQHRHAPGLHLSGGRNGYNSPCACVLTEESGDPSTFWPTSNGPPDTPVNIGGIWSTLENYTSGSQSETDIQITDLAARYRQLK